MLLVSSTVCSPRLPSSVRLHSTTCSLRLDLHLLQVFVGGVLVAVVLHLVEVAFLWCQHGVNLEERTEDNAAELPRRHQEPSIVSQEHVCVICKCYMDNNVIYCAVMKVHLHKT